MSITKSGAILLIVGLIVGAIAGYGTSFIVYKSDVSAKDSQISQLQTQLNTLNSTLLDVQAQLAEAVTNITLLRTQLEEAQGELMPGRVPILHVGDWWIMELVANGTTHTVTSNVTGEGPDYYVTYEEYNPPYQGRHNMTYHVDKSTTNPTWGQGQSEYTYDNTTITYTYNITFFYTYYGGAPFPLIVGKELNMSESMTYKTIIHDTTYTYEYDMSVIYKVEKIENVTVPAGTFTCFKIDMRNATSGDLVYTAWYSDEVKTWVKYIDYTTTPEATVELKDYSV